METVPKRALISYMRTTIITKNFRENISKELDNLSDKFEAISTRVDSLDAAIDDLQKYSFQYNVNIMGFPEDEHESAETTTQLCLKLFHAIGSKGVTKTTLISLIE